MNLSKKIAISAALAVGLGGLAMAPASEAGWAVGVHFGPAWFHRGGFHRGGWNRGWRGCRRVVLRRRCWINPWGYRVCRVVRRVRWVC